MTEKEVLTATDEWISWLKRLYTCTSDENKKQTQKHIELLEKLRTQAERVQELERVNKQLKDNLSVYKGYYKNMIKINEGIVEQNKRLRESIIEAIADIEEISPHEAKKTLREALKNIYELA